ncbi:hypothetical protein T492DRAFT_343581 [Pavlovales sp. CCMP2436]|nr:hypothetical protein T492DRAFT_343581 [Pavlovales sp. CCMP2436]
MRAGTERGLRRLLLYLLLFLLLHLFLFSLTLHIYIKDSNISNNRTNIIFILKKVARVMRAGTERGLGGGTHGSEGYGEATIGSVQKLVVLLQNLRKLILSGLYKDEQWNPMYDLTPLSTFVDIGSGYGKVITHVKLEAKVRRCVGIECVQSRHNIAEKVFFSS